MEDKLEALRAKLWEFAEMEEQMRREPNNWTLFFEAADLWEEITELFPQALDDWAWSDAPHRPTFWERVRNMITRRG